jgi:hypothetical protein
LVEGIVGGYTKRLLVLNSERAIDLSEIELDDGQDPSAVLRNGVRIMEMMNSGVCKQFLPHRNLTRSVCWVPESLFRVP